MATSYVVELTAEAEKVYARLHDEALKCLERGDPANSKVTTFNMVEEVLDKIIPHDPFNPSRALTGTFSNIFRIKKGRMRVCCIGSSREKKIIVLYISDTPRKEGDINDPYSVFSRLVLSGKFDKFFETIGVRRPDRGQPRSPRTKYTEGGPTDEAERLPDRLCPNRDCSPAASRASSVAG